MRKLLRILLVWGKTLIIKGVKYQLCYPTGFLKVVHRLINLMSIEDAFWILVGFIKEYPRLWCLRESSMLDDARSNYRYELTIVRAVLEVNFPQVSQRLYQLGVAIEALVYDSMTCLYSDYFHSDILLRIWDHMIFNFNTSQKKRGIWLVLAPALLIIAIKQNSIVAAKTAREAIDAYKDGCAVTFNPNKVLDQLNSLIDDLFVVENKQQERSAIPILNESGGTGSGTRLETFSVATKTVSSESRGFLAGLFSRQPAKELSQNPLLVDEARRNLQRKLDVVFDHQRARSQIVHEFLFKKGPTSAIDPSRRRAAN
jgi:hypothetical protein